MFRGLDVRKTGSGNIGATNVARTGSKGLAIATLFLDAAKGYAAVKFALWLASRQRLEGPIRASLYDRSLRWIEQSHDLPAGGAGGLRRDSGARVHCLAALQRRQGSRDCSWIVHCAGAPGDAGCAGAVRRDRSALTRYVSLGSIVACVAFPAGCLVAEARRSELRHPILSLIAAFVAADHRSAQRQHPPPAGRNGKPVSLRTAYE